jgi:UDP-N-acetylmuramate: L-alanyl-gamma-D-glutamyl-meso-diaminopimelate ligase
VREAYATYQLIACFELHTFSSLNEKFLAEYAHSMDAADNAIVYFSHHALDLKGLPHLDPATVKNYFARNDVDIIDEKTQLEQKVKELVTLSGQCKQTCFFIINEFRNFRWN